MSDFSPERLNAFFERIARGWIAAMPEGAWSEATLFWGPAGPVVYSSVIATDHKGMPHSVRLPVEMHNTLAEFRDFMSDEKRGAWISMEARITAEGVFDAHYNWDRRFYWGDHPGNPWVPPQEGDPVPNDAAYIEELQRYPRDPMHIPAWYPRLTEAPGLSQQRFAEQVQAPVTLPDECKPLMDAWGWPGVFELVNQSVLVGMTNASDDFAAALKGMDGRDEQVRALAEFRSGVVEATMRSLDESAALVPVRLWREWAATVGAQATEPAGLEAFNTSVPFGQVRDEEPLRPIEAELRRLVMLVAAQNLSDRFGVSLA